MNLQEKIANAKAQHAGIPATRVDVEAGGELIELGFRPTWGHQWQDLVATHPPRHGSDTDDAVGYNTDAVAGSYPVDAVTVDGEQPSEEDWRELYKILSAPNRTNIATVLFAVNQLDPSRRLVAASGKARRG
ncbi:MULTISPECIES: hypothetical protein [unclassified Microbacterium]|uniref:hypothetical protein n=1 Tax=unclassified Microbacterium TaxID=2609290 RepID=UPI0038633962